MNPMRCECHECTQYRARLGLGGLTGAVQGQMPPRCFKHDKLMVLGFYDRPGSPPGNGWTCQQCTNERAVAIEPEKYPQ